MTTDWLTDVADALRPALRVQAAVGGDNSGEVAEDHRLHRADDEVGQLREGVEAGQVRAGRAALDDHVEEVTPEHADHADQAVEQHGRADRGLHPRHDQALDRRDAEHLHRVDLLADAARAEVGADRAAARAGDDQRGHDRARLLHNGQHARRAVELLGADLAGERAELQRDHRAERDGDEDRRRDGHAGDEPELLDELPDLVRAAEHREDDVEAHRAHAAELAQAVRGPLLHLDRHAAPQPFGPVLPTQRSTRCVTKVLPGPETRPVSSRLRSS